MKKKIYILDDIYTKIIYKDMKNILTEYSFPVKDIIYNPEVFLEEIIKDQPKYILLDYWFRSENESLENPKGYFFLKKLDQLLNVEVIKEKKFFFFKKTEKYIEKKTFNTRIICISDNGEKLKKNFGRLSKYVEAYIPSKSGKELAEYILNN